MMAEELLSAAGPIERLIADKAYDTNRLRSFLKQRDIEAVILPAPGESPSFRTTGKLIANETSSSACSPGSRTSGASPRDTTSSPETAKSSQTTRTACLPSGMS
jgi:hypothetical protein